jgi:23S rRNA pseudouridine1911/1915/1917 synthase
VVLLERHTVPADTDDTRIYDYCIGLFDQLPSRKSVKKAIDKGLILVDNKAVKTGHWLKGGEELRLLEEEITPPGIYHRELPLHFEDNHIAVIFKPAGLLVSGNQFKTVVNAIQSCVKPSEEKDALPYPRPVHRLDKQTSGLLIIAKTRRAVKELGKMFEEGEISKTYHAVVLGKLEGKGRFNDPIEGKESLTFYSSEKVVRSLKSDHLSLIRLQPKTGRTHQLRIHLSNAGHAILGDPLYSPKNLQLKHKGLFLTADQLEFKHPITYERIKIKIEPPKKFAKRLESEVKRWKSANLD